MSSERRFNERNVKQAVTAEGGWENAECEFHPTFDADENAGEETVVLDKVAYVKLLIDARMTQSDCWPPGLEHGAALLGRMAEIEEIDVARHGAFVPTRLPRKLQDEYLQLNLALDELQQRVEDEASEHPPPTPSVAGGTRGARAASDVGRQTWHEFPRLRERENFA